MATNDVTSGGVTIEATDEVVNGVTNEETKYVETKEVTNEETNVETKEVTNEETKEVVPPEPGKWKLIYFDLRSRAEPIRLLLHFLGIEFHDERIPLDKWDEWKARNGALLPLGRVPVLIFPDGRALSQSRAILRFLGRQRGMTGNGELESARIDAMADGFDDFITEIHDWLLLKTIMADEEKAEEEYNKLKENDIIKKNLDRFDKFVADSQGDFLVGTRVSWADFFVAEQLHMLIELVDEHFLDKHLDLQVYVKKFYDLQGLRKYLANRKETPM